MERKRKSPNYCVNLLWGQKFYQPLRFVLCETDGRKSVFATTDLSADPIDVIEACSYRFKIEHSFKTFKHTFGGFGCHFWSDAVPKAFNHQDLDEAYSEVTDPKKRERILGTCKAVHAYVACDIVAMGCTQLLCQEFGSSVDPKDRPYQRTYKKNALSIGEMKRYFSQVFYRLCLEDPQHPLTQLIVRECMRFNASRLL